jgi:hypothetical protein
MKLGKMVSLLIFAMIAIIGAFILVKKALILWGPSELAGDASIVAAVCSWWAAYHVCSYVDKVLG